MTDRQTDWQTDKLRVKHHLLGEGNYQSSTTYYPGSERLTLIGQSVRHHKMSNEHKILRRTRLSTRTMNIIIAITVHCSLAPFVVYLPLGRHDIRRKKISRRRVRLSWWFRSRPLSSRVAGFVVSFRRVTVTTDWRTDYIGGISLAVALSGRRRVITAETLSEQ